MALAVTEEQTSSVLPSASEIVDASRTAAENGDAFIQGAKKRIRKKKEPRKRASDLHDVLVTPANRNPPPYVFRDGFRRVEPYHFTYNTWCKERWRGRGIMEVFEDEFRDRSLEYYKRAIETGNVRLNGQPVPSLDHIIKNGDLISHTLHRHEPPVSAEPIGIVHESEDMIVINKPAGIPVHPAGRYNYNSVTEILRSERGYGFNPLPCNRLDRLTSGIMFIAKHALAAERMTVQLVERSVRKEYVARVRGEFPSDVDGDVACDQPILSISPKLGLNRVRANGKPARTVFRRLAYHPSATPAVSAATGRRTDGCSIVRCRPLTGRTHQIRVHLQYLGHPIGNDPIYGNARVFGAELGAFCSTGEGDESILERLGRMGKQEVADAVAWHDEQVDRYEKGRAEKLSGEVCGVCGTELYTDPGELERRIDLHALRYEDAEGKWAYETELPKWALLEGETEGASAAVTEEEKLGGEVASTSRVVGDILD